MKIKELICGLLFLMLTYSIFFYFEAQQVVEITREDGLVEVIGASLFLLISIILFYCFCVNMKNRDPYVSILHVVGKNASYLFLSFIFFIAFGEEISWGQRIFNIATPGILSSMNVQNEITIHNIEIFNRMTMNNEVNTSFLDLITSIERIFSLFWFSCFVVLPIASYSNKKIRNFVQRISFPLAPLWVAILFVSNYCFSIYVVHTYGNSISANIRNVTELKECNFALLFTIVSLFCLSKVCNFSSKKRQGYHVHYGVQ